MQRCTKLGVVKAFLSLLDDFMLTCYLGLSLLIPGSYPEF